jgi:uncharacterized iron-regulated membrane protein
MHLFRRSRRSADWPEPRPEFLKSLAADVRRNRPAPRASRLALAGAFTVLLVVMLSAFGGIAYATSAAKQLTKVAHFSKATHRSQPARLAKKKPDDDQYDEEDKHCKKSEDERHHNAVAAEDARHATALRAIKSLPKKLQDAAQRAENTRHENAQRGEDREHEHNGGKCKKRRH